MEFVVMYIWQRWTLASNQLQKKHPCSGSLTGMSGLGVNCWECQDWEISWDLLIENSKISAACHIGLWMDLFDPQIQTLSVFMLTCWGSYSEPVWNQSAVWNWDGENTLLGGVFSFSGTCRVDWTVTSTFSELLQWRPLCTVIMTTARFWLFKETLCWISMKA